MAVASLVSRVVSGEKAEEDPDRLIYEWTDHINIPKWVAENAYQNCKHCNEPLKSGHRHHCRLCGEMYCSACTQKFHLQPNFLQKKGKSGPARVCLSCRDSCLKEKRKAEAAKEGRFRSDTTQGETYIWPKDWEDEKDFTACAKCNKAGGKPHNCRTCGRLYCSNCTSKMSIPSYFEKKQHHLKDGGDTVEARVCDDCRFKIVGGAKFLEKAPKTKKEIEKEKKQQEEEEDKAAEKAAKGMQLKIYQETSTKSWCTITIPDENANLEHIDDKLQDEKPPDFKYEYVFRKTAIPKAFWDLFTVKMMGPKNVCIREKVVEKKEIIMPIVTPIAEAVPEKIDDGKVNPFKRKEEPKEGEKKEEPKKVQASYGFKKPALPAATSAAPSSAARPAALASAPAAAGGPPPGLGSESIGASPAKEKTEKAPSAVSATPAASDDPFKARRQMFVQSAPKS